MLFKDDYSIQEQLHWFISNYMPANRRNFERRYVDSIDTTTFVQDGVIGVYTFDNDSFSTFCWLDALRYRDIIDYTQVFYPANEIVLGEYR